MHSQQLQRRQRDKHSASSTADEGLTIPVDAPDSTSRSRTSRTRPATTTIADPADASSTALPPTTRTTVVRNNSSSLTAPTGIIKVVSSPAASSSSASSPAASSGATSTSHTGAIVGAVAAVAGLALVAGLLFFCIRKRRNKQNVQAGYRRNEKDDDDRSFIGGLNEASGRYNEKDYGATPQQTFGLQDMPAKGDAPAWNNNDGSRLSYVHTPPTSGGHRSFDSIDGMANGQDQQDQGQAAGFGAFNHMQNGIMSPPPAAAMMNGPTIKPAVTGIGPYGAVPMPQSPNLANPPPIIVSPQEDESPFADPQWANKLFKVARTFQPSMPDELVIGSGNRIKILVAYDDGWCLGENLDAPGGIMRGVFPKDCVEEIGLNEVPLATPQSYETSANASRSTSPTKGAQNLTRAPTLPPLDLSNRDSQTYFSQDPKAKHASVASTQSLNHRSSMIDHFPAPAPGARPLKRASSLIASKDASLFVALGEALENDK